MEIRTNLRMLRHRHHIPLSKLAVHSGLSKQYISRAELSEIAATAQLEIQMSTALQAIIFERRRELRALEMDYMAYKGTLLKKGEHLNEQ